MANICCLYGFPVVYLVLINITYPILRLPISPLEHRPFAVAVRFVEIVVVDLLLRLWQDSSIVD